MLNLTTFRIAFRKTRTLIRYTLLTGALSAALAAAGSGVQAIAQTPPSGAVAAPGEDSTPQIDTSALINAQLDKQIKLNLNTVLPQAMEKITKETGVPIRADRAVWDLLPWGQDTNISAKIENQTLREALEAITRKLGLTFELRDEYVELRPMPALRRLARRSTIQELAALDTLSTAQLSDSTPTRLTVQQLLDAVDDRLKAIKSPYAVENRTRAEVVRPDSIVSISRGSTLRDAMDAMSRATAATWFPWGKTIVVLDKTDEIRRELNRTIDIRFAGVALPQVLSELQHRAGVRFVIEPGAIGHVPAEAQNIRLVLENSSIQDALDAIGGATGLAFTVEDDGVHVSNPSPAVAAHTPMIGLIQTDLGIELLLPESDVPPDVRDYLNYKRQEWIERARKQMKAEGFKPPTPATHPAASQPSEDL